MTRSGLPRSAVAGTVALALLLSGTVMLNTSSRAVGAPTEPEPVTAVSDPATTDAYPGAADPTSRDAVSKYPGRVWTDKSVYSDPSVAAGHGVTLGDNELGVELSALGTTRQVMGEDRRPLDVVFVLDTSQSMLYTAEKDAYFGPCTWVGNCEKSRAFALGKAANEAMKIIMEANPASRIGVATYANSAQVWVPLATPPVLSTGEYLHSQASDGNVSFQMNGKTLNGMSGGTNTQSGIYAGMQMLTSQNSADVTGKNQRIPVVILLSDGAPNYSQVSSSWWAPSGDQNDSGNDTTVGNGFKAAMTAAYMKRQINAVYNSGASDSDDQQSVATKIFTIGLGLEPPDNPTDSDLARERYADAALNPSGLDPSGVGSSPATDASEKYRDEFSTYQSDESVTLDTGNKTSYTMKQPTGSDAAYDPGNDPDGYKYNDWYRRPATTEDLRSVFEEIANTIVMGPPNYPTRTDDDPETSGYVAFNDTLGPFMEVKHMDSLSICVLKKVERKPDGTSGTTERPTECDPATFTPTSTTELQGGVTQYNFEGTVEANDLAGESDVSKLIVQVTHSSDLATGDVVQVLIPASLLPTRNMWVTIGLDGKPESMTHYASEPLHLSYAVGPKDGVLENAADPSGLNDAAAAAALSDYVKNNQVGGQARFYSNAFTPAAGGQAATANTTAQFEPSVGNDYYRTAQDTQLFSDEALKQPLNQFTWDALDDGSPVYYGAIEYYSDPPNSAHVATNTYTVKTTKGRLASKQNATHQIQEIDGVMTAPAGLYSITAINSLDHAKCAESLTWNEGSPSCAGGTTGNTTETAAMARNTVYDVSENGHSRVTAQLGNNSYLGMKVTTPVVVTPSFSKQLSGRAWNDSDWFVFQITTDQSDAPLPNPAVQSVTKENLIDSDSDTAVVSFGDISFSEAGSFDYQIKEVPPDPGAPGITYDPDPVSVHVEVTEDADGELKAAVTYDGQDTPEPFTNTFAYQPVSVDFTFDPKKELSGREWSASDAFSVRLCQVSPVAQDDKDCVREKFEQDGKGASTGTAVFRSLEFTQPGTYTYLLSEEQGDASGVAYSQAKYKWEVSIEDVGGTLVKSMPKLTQIVDDAGTSLDTSVPATQALFTNTYSAEPTAATPTFSKQVVDRGLLDSDSFDFKITPDTDGAPMPANDTVTVSKKNDNFNSFNFGEIKYNKAGTYNYTVSEEPSEPGAPGITYDPDPVRVQVVVADDGAGQLTSSVTYDGAPQASPFTNTYADDLDLDTFVNVAKTLNGRAISKGEFFYTVSTDDDASCALAGLEDQNCAKSFANDGADPALTAAPVPLRLTQQNLGKTYQFQVTEDDRGAAGMTYDTTEYRVKVAPYVSETDGRLNAKVTVSKDGAEPVTTDTANGETAQVSFTNTYADDLDLDTIVTVDKTLSGRELRSGEFSFTLSTDDDESCRVADLRETCSVTFSNDQADPAHTNAPNALHLNQDDLNATFRYQVTENTGNAGGVTYDKSVYSLEVAPYVAADGHLNAKVTVSKDGADPVPTDTADAETARVSFANTYAATGTVAAQPSFTKVLDGRGWNDDDWFDFKIKALTPEAPMPVSDTVTVSKGTAASFGFGDITYDKPGSYDYEVSEVKPAEPIPGISYSDAKVAVHVEVTDNLKGGYQAQVTYDDGQNSASFTNTYAPTGTTTATPEFKKVVSGRDWVDADSFEFEIKAKTEAAPLPAKTTVAVTKANADAFGFGPIEFAAAGKYEYEVVEHDPSAPGITPDGATVQVNVDVKDNGRGGFEAQTSYNDGQPSATFTNSFASSATVTNLTVAKTLTGRAAQTGEFSFTLTADDADACARAGLTDQNCTVTVTNSGADPLTTPFPTRFEFDQTDIGKTFAYQVTENSGSDQNIDYDQVADEVAITVLVDDATGDLYTTTTVTKDGKAVTYDSRAGATPAVPFTNTYDAPAWQVRKSATPDSGVVRPGDVITYTLTATKTAGDVVKGASATDDLSGVLANATLDKDNLPAGLTFDESNKTLTWSIGDLTDEQSVSYRVQVKKDAWGASFSNGVTASGEVPPTECDPATEVCEIDHETPSKPAWQVRKSATPDSGVVRPNDTITYTLTASKTAGDVVKNASATDDLGQVLEKATLDTASLPSGLTFDEATKTLKWDIGDLTADQSVSYSVTVNDDAWGASFTNGVTGDGEVPPTGCAEDEPGCEVTTTTPSEPAWQVRKSATPDSGQVRPKDTITYTLTAQKTAGDVVKGASASDDLTQVLEKATLDTASLPSGLTFDEANKTLHWNIGDLTADQSVSYSVTVHDGAWGAKFTNGVTGAGEVPPTGCDPEQEDCEIEHETPEQPAWTVRKSATPAGEVRPGSVITYTLTAKKTAGDSVKGASATDDLGKVLEKATLDTASLPSGLTFDEANKTLKWNIGDLTDDQSVSYSVTVNSDAWGASFSNAVTGSGEVPPTECAPDEPGCEVTTTIPSEPSWKVRKSVSPTGQVRPGDVITYTLTAMNTTGDLVKNASASDDLSTVLAHATLDTASLPSGLTFDEADQTLHWSIGDLADEQAVSYSVTVKTDAWGASFTNGVTGAGEVPPTDCAPDEPGCEVTTTIPERPAWQVRKSATPASGVVRPGDVITYTLTAKKTAGDVVKNATATDNLGEVLENATLDQAALPAGLTFDESNETLTWAIGDLTTDQSVSYSVTVKDNAWGASFSNGVTASGEVPPTECDPATEICEIDHETPSKPAWQVRKSATPTGVVRPGDVITYTLTAKKTAGDVVKNASASDDLTQVLEKATLDTASLPSGLTFDEGTSTLHWAIGDLTDDQSASYSVTVKDDAWGAKFSNAVTATGEVPQTECDPAKETCEIDHETPEQPGWTVRKSATPAGDVRPGDVITYTLTAKKTAGDVVKGASASDDLGKVLENATLDTASLSEGLTFDEANKTLKWDIGDLTADQSVSYSVTVNDDAWGASFTNGVTGDGEVPPTGCAEGEPGCEVTTTTPERPAWQVRKSTSASGVVRPGDVITYTLTATKTAGDVVKNASASDDLGDVLDSATLDQDKLPDGLSFDEATSTLNWAIGDLADEKTISYQVKVKDDAWGASFTNGVTGQGEVPPTGCAEDEPGCEVTTTSPERPAWQVRKSATPDSGQVRPKDTITYTLTATKTAGDVVKGASATDNLSNVLENATLDEAALPDGLSFDEATSTLHWNIGDLTGEKTISYSVTVKDGAWGASFSNAVSGAGEVPPTGCDPVTDPDGCEVTTTTPSQPAWQVRKSATPTGTVRPGDVITYTLTATKTAGDVVKGASAVDDLTHVLENATLDQDNLPTGLSFDEAASTLHWAIGDLTADQSVSYSVTVNDDAWGASFTNGVTGAGEVPPTQCSEGEPGCEVTTTVPSEPGWTVRKSADLTGQVRPGDVITYTLTATNTTGDVVKRASASDDLTGVVEHATLDQDSLPSGLTFDEPTKTLHWDIGDLSDRVSVSYQVQVNTDAWGASFTNAVTGTGEVPPTECAEGEPGCEVTTSTPERPAWQVRKSATPASGVVRPGDVITYTLTATKTAGDVVKNAAATDNLGDVLENATLDTASLPSGLSFDETAKTLKWSIGDLTADQSVSYSVTVNDGAWGASFTNAVSGAGEVPPTGCDPDTDPDGCEVTTTTPERPAWQVRKSATPASGVVRPKDTITYTLTASKTAGDVVKNASATDDLTRVLENATLDRDSLPDGLSFDEATKTLRWAIGDLTDEVSVSYSVTVNDDAWGASFTNAVSGAGEVPPTGCDPDTDPDGCEVTTTTPEKPAWQVRKSASPTGVVRPKDTITYTLTASKTAGDVVRNASASDDLSQVLEHATLDQDHLPTGLTFDEETSTLHWAIGDLTADQSVSYSVTVNDDAWNASFTNAASGAGEVPPTGCDPATDPDGCEVTTTTPEKPAWQVRKSADPASGEVRPNDTITYTLTASKTAGDVVKGASAVDDLTQVLEHATLDQDHLPTELTFDEETSTLHWAIGDLTADQSVSYQVTVNDDAWGASFTNSVSGAGEVPPTGCDPDTDPDGCEVTTTTPSEPAWQVRKSVSPTGQVRPNDTITYTLTAKKTAGDVVKGASASDDLTQVLENATLDDSLPTGVTFDEATSTLHWNIGDLTGEKTISYSVTVNDDAWGASFTNAVTGSGEVPPTECAPDEPGCEVTTTTPSEPAWQVRKSATPDSGVVRPKDTITYTLTATKTAGDVVKNASASDDLTQVLANATLDTAALSDGLSFDDATKTLHWNIGDLTDEASVSYSVRVNDGAWGAKFSNGVAGSGEVPPTGCDPATEVCETEHETPAEPAWQVRKSATPASGVVRPKDTITYTLTASKTAGDVVKNASASDDLAHVLENATLDQDNLPDGLTFDEATSTLHWAIGDLTDEVSVSYQVTVNDGAWGASFTNAVTGAGEVPPTACDPATEVCETTHETPSEPAWQVRKSATPDSGEVRPGDVITYTLTAKKTAGDVVKGASAVDDLTQVLANATLDTSSLPSNLTFDEATKTLKWAIGDLTDDVSVSYQVAVKDGAWGISFTNGVTGAGEVPPTACDPATEVCEIEHETPSQPGWKVRKSVSPTGEVRPGDVITYTLTATNTTGEVVKHASASDDLTGVLEKATLDQGNLPDGLTFDEGAKTLTWAIGDLTDEKTVSYTVTVKPDAWGASFTNAVSGAGEVPSTECAPEEPGCEVTTTIPAKPAWQVRKSATPDSGQVRPGDVITYTLTATKTAGDVVKNASASDDLAEVLDSATLDQDNLSTGLTFDETNSTLHWAIGDLTDEVSVSYQVTVKDDAWGASFTNAVSGAGEVPPTGCDPDTDPDGCEVTTTTPSEPGWKVRKSVSPTGVVRPSDVITYTLTATKTAGDVVKNASASDDLSQVLQSATLDQDNLPEGLTFDGANSTLNWAIGDLTDDVSVSYSVTVNDGAWGASFTNGVSGAGEVPPTECAPEEPGCEVTTTTPSEPAWQVRKSASPTYQVRPGDVITYTLTATKTAGDVVKDASATDNLSNVLENATLDQDNLPAGLTFDEASSILHWDIGDLTGEQTVSYTVTVKPNAWNASFTNGVTGQGEVPPTECDPEEPGCEVTVPTPDGPTWKVRKSTDSAGVVRPGDVITYTLTAAKTAGDVVKNASASDDLKDVLSHATLMTDSLPSGLSFDESTSTLHWAIGDLSGEQAVSYQVQVKPDAWGASFTNGVTGQGEVPPTDCAPGVPGCEVTITTPSEPAWQVRKSADPASGVVRPGDVITYQLTASKTAGDVVKNASATDDLSGVLKYATLKQDALPANVTFDEATKTLTWAIGDLTADQSVSYSVTVNDGAWGASFTNAVSGTGEVPPTGCAPDEPGCEVATTTPERPAWQVRKSASPMGEVRPGDVITYTLAASKTAGDVVKGASASDDLSGVLQHATLDQDNLSDGLSFDESSKTLKWAIGDLTDDQSVSYSVTVNDDAWGASFTNAVSGAGEVPPTGCDPATDPDGCEVTTTTPSEPAWQVRKSADPASGVVRPGDVITYTLTATKTAGDVVKDASATDDLSQVLAHTALDTSSLPSNLTFDDATKTLKWAIGDLTADQSVSYQVTVNSDAWGASFTNAVTGAGEVPPTGCDPAEPGCEVTTTTPSEPGWKVRKSATPRGQVRPGDVITYTLTATKTAGDVVKNASATDDLADVLKFATLDQEALPSDVTFDEATKTLKWAIGDLTDEVSVSYQVTVNDGAWGASFTNGVIGAGEVPPTGCNPAVEVCETEHETPSEPAWQVRKSADPASGVVRPGDEITYTLTATKTAGDVVKNASATDDLTQVLENATLDKDNLPTGVTFDEATSTLHWAIGDLTDEASVSYSVTVNDGAWGASFTNGVTGSGEVPPTGCAPEEPGCEVTTTTPSEPAWQVRKSVDPASGQVRPGDVITYTLTATKTAGDVVKNASAIDDLTQVLANATLDQAALPAGLAFDEATSTLHWGIGDLAGEQTVSYTVTVNDGAWGASFTNGVIGQGEVPPTECTPDEPGCEVTTTVPSEPAWQVRKSVAPASGVVRPGDVITYTLTATKTAGDVVKNASAVDDLTQVLEHATLDQSSLPAELSFDNATSTLHWSIGDLGDVPKTVSYSVTVDADAWGASFTNGVIGSGEVPSTGCDPATDPDGCEVTTTTPEKPAWQVRKSADPASGVVRPGDVITYTLTATKTAGDVVQDASATDNLGEVLENATLDRAALPAGLTFDEATSTLHWAIGDLSDEKSVSYTVTVNDDAWGASFTNGVTGQGEVPPTGCDPATDPDGCEVTTTTPSEPAWQVRKSATPDSGEVRPGDVITYTLTATKTAGDVVKNASAVDDLTQVLANATLDQDNLPADVTFDEATSTLHWAIGDLTADQSVSYSVTVNDDAWGASFTNAVTGTGEVPPTGCDPATDPDGCEVTTTVPDEPSWHLLKTANPPSGAEVNPGDTVTYTLTATPDNDTPVRDVVITDDLSQVLPSGDLGQVNAPRNTTYTVQGDQLVWTIGTLDQELKLDYQVTLHSDVWNTTVRNHVTGSGEVPPIGCDPATDPDGCEVTTTVPDAPTWSVVKTANPPSGTQIYPGDTVTYTLNVTPEEGRSVRDVTVTDDLSSVLAGADLVEISDPAAQIDPATSTLSWPIGLLDQPRTLTYSVKIHAAAVGVTLRNHATGSGEVPPIECDPVTEVCGTEHEVSPLPSWSVAKTADPPSGTEVHPGDTVTYTLTVTPEAGATVKRVTVTDDLSQVLPFADVDQVSVPDGTSAVLDPGQGRLVWNVGTLSGELQLTYQARVHADASGATLSNLVVGVGGNPGGNPPQTCTPSQPCLTEHTIQPGPALPSTPPNPASHTGGVLAQLSDHGLAVGLLGLCLIGAAGATVLVVRRRHANDDDEAGGKTTDE